MKLAFKYAFVAIPVMLSFAAPVAAGPVEDAMAACDRGDYTTAVRLLRPLAEQGDAQAQYNLGVLYDNGQGVPQNSTEAVKWYSKAADQGDSRGENNLANMYLSGQGVPQNYTEAMKWFRKAADQGNARAQRNLGLMYSNGQGVPKDDAEAGGGQLVSQGRRSGSRCGSVYPRNNLPSRYGRAAERRRGGEVVPQGRRSRLRRRTVQPRVTL